MSPQTAGQVKLAADGLAACAHLSADLRQVMSAICSTVANKHSTHLPMQTLTNAYCHGTLAL